MSTWVCVSEQKLMRRQTRHTHTHWILKKKVQTFNVNMNTKWIDHVCRQLWQFRSNFMQNRMNASGNSLIWSIDQHFGLVIVFNVSREHILGPSLQRIQSINGDDYGWSNRLSWHGVWWYMRCIDCCDEIVSHESLNEHGNDVKDMIE